MYRDPGEWRHGRSIFPSALLKGGQWRQRCLFIIGVGAGKSLGVRRIFARISPNLPEKFFVQFFLQIFSQKDHEDFFLV